jgi:hypothetical protein
MRYDIVDGIEYLRVRSSNPEFYCREVFITERSLLCLLHGSRDLI